MLKERLEIRLDAETMRMLREEARRRGVSLGQLIRHSINWLLREERDSRLRAADELCETQAPAPDWEIMKREIEEARFREHHREEQP